MDRASRFIFVALLLSNNVSFVLLFSNIYSKINSVIEKQD
ncbi:hypothetical protein CLOSTMETH_03153 [[Clostridium] methylpentosum DSM 5476]|uniref:Uncharacterized protein n=1 Tax=[Clostridium] methylpentosum DSM 5476 TaxID=537013 RepID=C0EH08_9FIRM|nr:hypothetical protein CLOSTMETH_03153 [[Clostridium] methylpentosum DSM 5476]